MVEPRNLNDSTSTTVLSITMSGKNIGVLPEVNHHLQFFDRVQLQVVVTTIYMRQMAVESSANFRSFTEGSFALQLFMYKETWRENHNPMIWDF